MDPVSLQEELNIKLDDTLCDTYANDTHDFILKATLIR